MYNIHLMLLNVFDGLADYQLHFTIILSTSKDVSCILKRTVKKLITGYAIGFAGPVLKCYELYWQ